MGEPGPVESGHSPLLPLGQCVSEGAQLWRRLCQGKSEPGRQCSHGTDRDKPLCHPACWDPGQLSSVLQPCLSLPRAGHTPKGLHVGRWETGQVAPSHPAWFGQVRKEEINAFVFVLGAASRSSLMGSWLVSCGKGCSPGEGSLVAPHSGAPGNSPLSPAAVPSPSAAPVSWPSPNSPLLSHLQMFVWVALCLGCRLRPRPSWRYRPRGPAECCAPRLVCQAAHESPATPASALRPGTCVTQFAARGTSGSER